MCLFFCSHKTSIELLPFVCISLSANQVAGHIHACPDLTFDLYIQTVSASPFFPPRHLCYLLAWLVISAVEYEILFEALSFSILEAVTSVF